MVCNPDDPGFRGGVVWNQVLHVRECEPDPSFVNMPEETVLRYVYSLCTDHNGHDEGIIFRGINRYSFVLHEDLMTWDGLVTCYRIRPIKDDNSLARAISMIDWLIDRGELSDDQKDYLDILSLIVADYEDRAHPMPSPRARVMLLHLVEAKGVSFADVAVACHSTTESIEALVTGAREFNRIDFMCLGKFFNVEPSVFLPTLREIRENDIDDD